MFQRQYEWALREYKKATDFDPDFHVAHWMASWCMMGLGRHDEAAASATRAIEASKGLLVCYPSLARAHALAGRKDEARRILAELEAKSPARYVEPVEVAIAYDALGERDTAFAWLERGFRDRSHWLLTLNVEPRFDAMREDPRFQDLKARVGVPA
jgi:tetratricopeptide (TPR) repeat protein